MCISLVLYDSHPALLLLLAFNRDEFWDRPTQPAHFWPDEPSLLAGRDALRKGTWLGVTKHGRFALLTNFREPMSAGEPGKFVTTTTAPSRGALTTNFLTGTMPPLQYLQSLDLSAYYGFNLMVGDLHTRQVAYVCNRDPQGPRLLGPGHYGISNGLLQEWPKVQKCRQALASVLELPHPAPHIGPAAAAAAEPPEHSAAFHTDLDSGVHHSLSSWTVAAADHRAAAARTAAADHTTAAAHTAGGQPSSSSAGAPGPDDAALEAAEAAAAADGDLPWPVLFHHVMGDSQLVPPDQDVPLTGVGEHMDRRLSSVFIEPFEMQPGVKYGTRSQTVIAVWRDGRVEQRERYVEKVEGQAGDDDEVLWVWREQQHAFALAAPAGSEQQDGMQQQQQQGQQLQQQQQHAGQQREEGQQPQEGQQREEGQQPQEGQQQAEDEEPWHIVKVHLQQPQQP